MEHTVRARPVFYVRTCRANRERIKRGEVGVVKLAEARAQARNILAERQLGIRKASGIETYEPALAAFLEAAALLWGRMSRSAVYGGCIWSR